MNKTIKEALKNHLESRIGKIDDIIPAESDKGLEDIIVIASDQSSIVVKFSDNDKKDLQLFLKICKAGSLAEHFNKELYTFVREAYFYENIAPELKLSLSKASVESDFILDFYGEVVIEHDIYLILEDFVKNNYFVTPKNEFHDLKLIRAAVIHLAQFHASFFNTVESKQKKWEDFLGKRETFVADNSSILKPYYQGVSQQHLKVVHALAKEIKSGNEILLKYNIKCPNIGLVEKLQEISDGFLNIFIHYSSRESKFNTISHGDFHMWNIAYEKSNVSKVKFFDYQSPRFASVMNDILQYLYQVSTVEFRKNHLAEIFDLYVKNFNDVIKISSPQKIITQEEIYDEFKAVSPYGFLYGFSFILPRYVKKEFYEKIDDVKSSKEIIDLISNEAISDEVWEKLSLMSEMIDEANELGSISVMEEIICKE